jgi:predicted RNA-binding protein with PIN domain
MRWLVDGYNVIRRDPDLRAREAESLEAGRRALLALCAGAARASGDSFTVVFDGAPGPARAAAGGQVEVVFSRPPRTADDVLMERARRAGAGAALVSSDRRVQDAARRAGCAAVDAGAFVAALDAGAGAGDDRDDEEPGREKRGNPRRRSKAARAAARALRRLRFP